MTIRRLTPLDLGLFIAMRDESRRLAPDSFRTSLADLQALGDDYWRQRLGTDHVVGYFDPAQNCLGIGGLQRFVGERLDHKGLIWGMYVRKAARGTGAADAIIAALIEAARPELRQLQLTLFADNTPARRLYERHGFTTFAIEPAAIRTATGFADEALMWRLV